MGKRSWLKANALSVVSFAGFLIFLILQAIAGWNVYNSELEDFGEAVFENWESEFLQMGVFVVLTAYLVQRGSAESKKLNEPKPAAEVDGNAGSTRTASPSPFWACSFFRSSLICSPGSLSTTMNRR